MTVVPVRISASGRMSLPAEIRKAMGIEKGGDLIIEIDGGEVRLRSHSDVVAEARSISRRLLSDDPDAGVDSLIAARRREAARE